MDFIQRIFTDFSEIHGDRAFGDDLAMVCGLARFHGEEVMAIGNLKGRGTKEKVRRNFGMPNPEGYRKALRAMKIAEKFHRPVFTFIDLTGANPGIAAEERGQAEAIARNLREMARLARPDDCHHYRRRGFGRRLGAGGRRSRSDDGKCRLLGHCSRSVRFDHVAGRRQARPGRGSSENYLRGCKPYGLCG